jgi:hypothetical protein
VLTRYCIVVAVLVLNEFFGYGFMVEEYSCMNCDDG